MANSKTNELITMLLKQNETLIATLNAMMNESSSKKSTTKGSKSTTKTATKGSKEKATTSSKDETPKNSYRVSYIHPSDYLDAFAHKLFLNNLINEKTYDNIRTCHDIKQRQKFLETLSKKAKKYNPLLRVVFLFNTNYLIILATSSAKLSSLFSRPSPFTRRIKLSTLISAPVVFATFAT